MIMFRLLVLQQQLVLRWRIEIHALVNIVAADASRASRLVAGSESVWFPRHVDDLLLQVDGRRRNCLRKVRLMGLMIRDMVMIREAGSETGSVLGVMVMGLVMMRIGLTRMRRLVRRKNAAAAAVRLLLLLRMLLWLLRYELVSR